MFYFSLLLQAKQILHEMHQCADGSKSGSFTSYPIDNSDNNYRMLRCINVVLLEL